MANRRPVARFKLLHNDREAIMLYYGGSEWEGWREACDGAEVETARMFAVAATRWKLFAASGTQGASGNHPPWHSSPTPSATVNCPILRSYAGKDY